MDIQNIINENPTINITINAKDLLTFGNNIARQTADAILNDHEEKLYTRKEVIKKFNVCSATLWRWSKLDLIVSQKIGNRVYYSESEIKRLTGKNGGAKC